MEHLVTTGMTDVKCNRGKLREMMMKGMAQWLEFSGRNTENNKGKRDVDANDH